MHKRARTHTHRCSYLMSTQQKLSSMQSASPIYMDISGLTNSMAAVLSLSIHGRIPVTVIENDRVGTRQIYTNATRACGQDETEDALVSIEAVHKSLHEPKFVVIILFKK